MIELIDHPSYIKKQLLEHDAYISCLQLKKVNVAHDAMHNNYLYNHTAYYHVLQQVIAFLVISSICHVHMKVCAKFDKIPLMTLRYTGNSLQKPLRITKGNNSNSIGP